MLQTTLTKPIRLEKVVLVLFTRYSAEPIFLFIYCIWANLINCKQKGFDFVSQMQGLLSDGTLIAVKQLSSKSKQGNREFVNEIGMISALQHPNLVKLYGCCIEGNQLLLVYEYMANNSLAHTLFGKLDNLEVEYALVL